MNTLARSSLQYLGGAAALLMVAGVALPVHADDVSDTAVASLRVVEPGQTLFGKSYNRLVSEWTNWLSKEPIATNPALDIDGRNCDRNQRGDIWFLAGTFGGALQETPIANRHCEIPAGKALFFSIFSFVSFAPEFLNQVPCDVLTGAVRQIRCDVNDDIAIAPNVILKVSIDGKPVGDLFAYRTQSQPGGFIFYIAPDSPLTAFGISPGLRKPAVADGYYMFLKPLSPGHHTVRFSVDFDTDGQPDSGANYRLLVVR